MSQLNLHPPLNSRTNFLSKHKWLPPLNSQYDNFIISVNAKQGEILTSTAPTILTPPKNLDVRLKAVVEFYSAECPSFNAFVITRSFDIIPSYNAICNILLHPELVPFQLDGAKYCEERLSPDESKWSWEMETEDALIQRLSEFLQEQASSSSWVSVYIKKRINIPEALLKSHNAWKGALPVSDKLKYQLANTSPCKQHMLIPDDDAVIRRGRVSYELDTDGECLVCWEGSFGCGGPSKLKRMSCCSRVFHRDCIDRWLKTSNTCPLCWQSVPYFSMETVIEEKLTQEQEKKNRHSVMYCLPDSHSSNLNWAINNLYGWW